MSIWSHKRRKVDELDALDDVEVDRLLDGRYGGDSPELLVTSQLVEHMRAFAGEPVPPPSAALIRILCNSAPANGDVPTVTGTGSVPRRRRPRLPGVPTAAAAVSLALAAVVAVAGSARLLPGPTQDMVAAIVRAITPFDFPQQREPDAVLSRSRPPGAAPISQTSSGTRAATPPGMAEPGTRRDRTTAGEGSGGPAPASSTTVTPRPSAAIGGTAPTVTPTTGRAPGAVSGPAPPGPPPSAPRPSGLSADLRGGQGAPGSVGQGFATVDTNPGKNELCLTLTVSTAAPVTSVHLHAGSVGGNGPVVAAFTPPPTAGTSTMCVTVTDRLLSEIRQEPGKYYVEVHTLDLLYGALRGQLTN